MSRLRLLTIASLSVATLAAMTTGAFCYLPTGAEQHARRTCEKSGVRPDMPAWELCLSQATRAYEWGDAGLAEELARASAAAGVSCQVDGMRPATPAFRTCLETEIDSRTELLILGDDHSAANVAQVPAGNSSARLVQQ
jgi:hypothetical protein